MAKTLLQWWEDKNCFWTFPCGLRSLQFSSPQMSVAAGVALEERVECMSFNTVLMLYVA